MESRAFLLTERRQEPYAQRPARSYITLWGAGENLRDNMTNTELVLNMLAELSTKRISEVLNPETMDEHADVAKQGGEVARNARMELEAKIGEKAITSLNAKQGILKNSNKE
jgi:hypothetical protein